MFFQSLLLHFVQQLAERKYKKHSTVSEWKVLFGASNCSSSRTNTVLSTMLLYYARHITFRWIAMHTQNMVYLCWSCVLWLKLKSKNNKTPFHCSLRADKWTWNGVLYGKHNCAEQTLRSIDRVIIYKQTCGQTFVLLSCGTCVGCFCCSHFGIVCGL